jgi:hypothetical protein
MRSAQPKDFRLDIRVFLDGFLPAEGRADRVQQLLRELVPKWSTELHVWRYQQPKVPIDVSAPGALAESMLSVATEHGPFFHELERRFGAASHQRLFGSAELRGSDRSLTLVVSTDEDVFSRTGASWLWGNHVTFQVCRAKVEGSDAITWATRAFEVLCASLSPPWAHAQVTAEYAAKNISREGGGMRAVGVDISRALPGLYWLNFYGRACRDRIGRERLLTAPAARVGEVDDGVLLMLHPDPTAWDTPEYEAIERGVLDHLGPEHFFSKEAPERKTVPPVEGLPLLPATQPVGEPEKLQDQPEVWWRLGR